MVRFELDNMGLNSLSSLKSFEKTKRQTLPFREIILAEDPDGALSED